jgi:hypothetical protein
MEVVGDELKSPKATDFTKGEATGHQSFTVNADDKRGSGNHQNVREKGTL